MPINPTQGKSITGLVNPVARSNPTAPPPRPNMPPEQLGRHTKFRPGAKFGKLTLIKRKIDRTQKTANKRKQWLCECDCKAKRKKPLWIPEYYLRRRPNPKRDCGCSRRSNKMTHNKEYRIWYMMNTRTTNKDHVAYKHYGGRGISVCDRWKWGPNGGELDGNGEQVKDGFTCFLEDMGARPNKDMSIDRIDNDKNYMPGNVKWATAEEQGKNRRSKEQVARDLKEYRKAKRAEREANSGNPQANASTAGVPGQPQQTSGMGRDVSGQGNSSSSPGVSEHGQESGGPDIHRGDEADDGWRPPI